MILFEFLKLMRVFLDYLRIEYLWHVLIMPLTNRNSIRLGDLLEPIRGGNGSNAAAIDARTHRDA